MIVVYIEIVDRQEREGPFEVGLKNSSSSFITSFAFVASYRTKKNEKLCSVYIYFHQEIRQKNVSCFITQCSVMVVTMLNVPGSMDFTNNKTMALNSKFCQNGKQYFRCLALLLFFSSWRVLKVFLFQWTKVLFECFCTGVELLVKLI